MLLLSWCFQSFDLTRHSNLAVSIFAPKGLLCRGVYKSMLVSVWLLAPGSVGRSVGHEIGTSSSIGSVFGPAGSTLNTLGVQKQDHFVLGGRMSLIWQILNYRVLMCVGHVWTPLHKSPTIALRMQSNVSSTVVWLICCVIFKNIIILCSNLATRNTIFENDSYIGNI